jgi:hypothetical protein
VRRAPLFWILAILVANASAAEPLPDGDLLEFLGSIDSDEPGWHEFLETGTREGAGKTPAKVAPPRRGPAETEVKP